MTVRCPAVAVLVLSLSAAAGCPAPETGGEPDAGSGGGSSGGSGGASSGVATSGGATSLGGGPSSGVAGSSSSRARSGSSDDVVSGSSSGFSASSESGAPSGDSSGVPPSSSSPASSSSSSSASGLASSGPRPALLGADPALIDFGVMPQGGTATRVVRVTNIGGEMVRLGVVSVETNPPAGATTAPSIDNMVLGEGGETTFTVHWTQQGVDQLGAIRIPVQGSDGYQLVITIMGAMESGPPNCTCPGPQETVPLATLSLTATCNDPEAAITGYRWSVDQRPSGSTALPSPDNALTTSFFVDLAGDYVLRMTALQLRGDPLTSCTTPIHAVPPQDLHVQLVWDTDSSDVDLHLLGPSGGTYFDSTNPGDCYYAHRRAQWGGPGTDDDATLDIDDTNGYGPENINVISPQAGTYTVGVHYYCPHGVTGATNATVRVFCNGALRRELQRAFTAHKQFWDVATVTWPGCTVTDGPSALRTVTQGCSP